MSKAHIVSVDSAWSNYIDTYNDGMMLIIKWCPDCKGTGLIVTNGTIARLVTEKGKSRSLTRDHVAW